MTEDEICSFFKELLPDDLQFADPFDKETPVPETDYATMAVLCAHDKGWTQEREIAFDPSSATVDVAYDVQRVYVIRFEFFGTHAFDYARLYKQTLHVNLRDDKSNTFSLKQMSEIRNPTLGRRDERYQRRYRFDLEVFAVDTVVKAKPYITAAEIKINHFQQ